MKLLTSGLALIKEHRRSFFMLNVLYFSLVGAGMFVGGQVPEIHAALRRGINEAADGGPLTTVAKAYRGGHLLPAIGLTFAVNLVGGSFLSITLPSLILPFSGIAMGCLRAFVWGLIFSPGNYNVNAATWGLTIVLILLEGEAYIIVMLAAYLQGKAFLFPPSVGATGYWKGYRVGAKRTAQIYPLIVVQLIVAAIYEVVSTVLLRPLVV